MMTTCDHLMRYAQDIRNLRRASANSSERTMAPAFQYLIERLLSEMLGGQGVIVVPEYDNPGIGRPDIALCRPGEPARAFIELKAPTKSANPAQWKTAHDRRQRERMSELMCWASSNFVELHLHERNDSRARALIVPERALDPTCTDGAAERLIRRVDNTPLLHVVEQLAAGAGQGPVARDSAHLAALLARSARLVRGIIQERLAELRQRGVTEDPLLDVHAEFRNVLYAHPEAGGYPTQDFDVLFSSAFAQTLAFGLLLVREGSGRPVDADAYLSMPAEHPLMRTALRVLTQTEILGAVGIGFTVLIDTVNSFNPAILALHPGRPDPILYFYEDFLGVFDPDAREKHGVYYTPVEVVRFMAGALDRAVRDHLGLVGLRDPGLTILDPAAGTGTFLLGVAERVREESAAAGGAGFADLQLRELARRMFGLELLVGPYAVAHYRLHHRLRDAGQPQGQRSAGPPLPRLGVYLADTLSEPGAATPAGRLGFVSRGISEERRSADHVKSNEPILAIIGNPPYRRLEQGEVRTLVGDWLNAVWNDLKRPVQNAGHGDQLNTFPELSVAFWRWAIWKLFEADNAPRRGVIAFITNRKFLTGWPYAGLRQTMRQRFDRIEIIDLRGDVRRGPRAGVNRDVGVFDIQVGTAITIAIADGSRQGQAAEVVYLDAWTEEKFSRRAKLEWLAQGATAGRLPNAVAVDRDTLDDFRPRPFGNGEWPSLKQCFSFRISGIQTKRDDFVYDVDRDRLRHRLEEFLNADAGTAREVFCETDRNTAELAQQVSFDEAALRQVMYRPLDRRTLYLHHRYCDRRRPDLLKVWGESNVALYALPSGTGRGPAVWCHGLLPDYHAFRGSYGGYAFPLHDRRPEVAATNISEALLDGLAAAYGVAVEPGDVFDAILCLLSARSYTHRFAEDLEDVFPHVPLPATHDVFIRAAAHGAGIRAIQTFARPPERASNDRDFVRLLAPPNGNLKITARHEDKVILCADGSGQVEGLPPAVWDFEVSGYPVLQRWLDGRVGMRVDLALFNEFRDICARILELLALFETADTLLAEALEMPLSRDVLGLENN